MSGTARSHTKLRRTQAGTALLDRRSRGAFGSNRKVATVLRRLDRPDAQDEVVRLLDERDGRVLGVRPTEWVRLAADRFHRFVGRLPDPEPVAPAPLAVRTFVVDGVAHVVAAAPGTRLADATPCLGCGVEAISFARCRRCEPDDTPMRDHRPRHRWVLRVVDRSVADEVVALTRVSSETSTGPVR